MKVKARKIWLLLGIVLTVLLLLAGCTRAPVARGWAGVTKVDKVLVFITMSGRVYSVDSATGLVIGEPIKMVLPASGGLSCIPSCSGQQTTAVAIYASPVVGADLVIIGGYDGKVYAYPLLDGRLREQPKWIYPPQGNIGSTIVGGLTLDNGKVYFASSTGTVFALNAADGYKEWSFEIGQKIWSGPAVSGNTLFIGGFDKKLYALDVTSGTKKWEFESEGAISAIPVVKDNLVYIGSYDRHIYAINTGSGQLVWKFPSDDSGENTPKNWFWTKPVISGNRLFAPCLDGKIYVLDTNTGIPTSSPVDLKKPVSSAPVLVDNNLVVAASDLAKNASRLYIIDINSLISRELASLNEGVNAPLFSTGGIIYLHTTRDNFYGLNPVNGALQKFSLTTPTTQANK